MVPTNPVEATEDCGLVSRSIDGPAQVDQITFSGLINDHVTLTLAAAAFPFGATATATVFSPTAAEVVTFSANSQQQLTLPATGTYVIQVRANNLVSTGSYTLGRESLVPTRHVDAALDCGVVSR